MAALNENIGGTLVDQAYSVLDTLRLPNGLYIASTSADYRYVWIRDNCYVAMAYLDKHDGKLEHTVHRLFEIFRDYAWKIEYVKQAHPTYTWQYLHARYSVYGDEITDQEWGHAQNDMIGAFLWLVGEAHKRGHNVVSGESDRRVLRALVEYLAALEYWHDADNGMWEENIEVHASSIGACVAGLDAIRDIVDMPDALIEHGIHALHKLFPRESATKQRDMALLSLIYPYRLYSDISARVVLRNVEQLVRDRGVIRYDGDKYYTRNGEAEWPMGLCWLALCWWTIGDADKAREYVMRANDVMSDGTFAESYYAGTTQPNANTPLGWTASLYAMMSETVR